MGMMKLSAILYSSHFLPYLMRDTPYGSNPDAYREDEQFKRILRQKAGSLSLEQIHKIKQVIAKVAAQGGH
jgi:hypothetical protein